MKFSNFQTTRHLFLLTAGILMLFGIGSLMRMPGVPDQAALYVFYALLMLADAAVVLFCYFQLKRKSKPIYWLAFIVLSLNIVLTIFDQVGLVDILFMLLNAVALAALNLSPKDFLPA
jgi:Na+/melibiose symporter-like transporter